MNDFFKNEKELVANAGRAYTKLQGYNSEQSLWTLLLQASDECAVPACGGSWYSNGRYEEIQTNKIPPANKLLTRGWNWIFNGIAACNEIIYETELSPIQFEGKEKIIAEMKILRAFYYYQAISCWGNVPFTTDYTETGYPEQKSREYIFNYLEKEINDNIEFRVFGFRVVSCERYVSPTRNGLVIVESTQYFHFGYNLLFSFKLDR